MPRPGGLKANLRWATGPMRREPGIVAVPAAVLAAGGGAQAYRSRGQEDQKRNTAGVLAAGAAGQGVYRGGTHLINNRGKQLADTPLKERKGPGGWVRPGQSKGDMKRARHDWQQKYKLLDEQGKPLQGEALRSKIQQNPEAMRNYYRGAARPWRKLAANLGTGKRGLAVSAAATGAPMYLASKAFNPKNLRLNTVDAAPTKEIHVARRNAPKKAPGAQVRPVEVKNEALRLYNGKGKPRRLKGVSDVHRYQFPEDLYGETQFKGGYFARDQYAKSASTALVRTGRRGGVFRPGEPGFTPRPNVADDSAANASRKVKADWRDARESGYFHAAAFGAPVTALTALSIKGRKDTKRRLAQRQAYLGELQQVGKAKAFKIHTMGGRAKHPAGNVVQRGATAIGAGAERLAGRYGLTEDLTIPAAYLAGGVGGVGVANALLRGPANQTKENDKAIARERARIRRKGEVAPKFKTGQNAYVGKSVDYGYREQKVSARRAAQATAGTALLAWGGSRLKVLGPMAAHGVKLAEKHGGAKQADQALRIARQVGAQTRNVTGQGEQYLRGYKRVANAIDKVPAHLQPAVATAAGALLVQNARPVRTDRYTPIARVRN